MRPFEDSVGREQADASEPEVRQTSAYDFYILGVLTTAYMLSFLDRTLISLLIPQIKGEFALTDTQVGMLIGFGFVLFYSVLGLPFGSLADRSNRVWLILSGLVVWSVATSASGFAGSFGALLVMRALVGVGEATLSPSAYSTIADRFTSDRLGLAVAIYQAGVSVGSGLALMFGGALAVWSAGSTMTLPIVGTFYRLASDDPFGRPARTTPRAAAVSDCSRSAAAAESGRNAMVRTWVLRWEATGRGLRTCRHVRAREYPCLRGLSLGSTASHARSQHGRSDGRLGAWHDRGSLRHVWHASERNNLRSPNGPRRRFCPDDRRSVGVGRAGSPASRSNPHAPDLSCPFIACAQRSLLRWRPRLL